MHYYVYLFCENVAPNDLFMDIQKLLYLSDLMDRSEKT